MLEECDKKGICDCCDKNKKLLVLYHSGGKTEICKKCAEEVYGMTEGV